MEPDAPNNLNLRRLQRSKRRARVRLRRLLLLLWYDLLTIIVYVFLAVACGYAASLSVPEPSPVGGVAVFLYVVRWIACVLWWGLSLFLLVRCFYRLHGRKLWTRPRTPRNQMPR